MTSSSRVKLPITGLSKQARLSSSALPTRIAITPGRLLLVWLPTFLWLCVLAAFSTDTFSAAHTGVILGKVVRFIYPGITAHQFEVLHFLVRKSAHFTCYGFLSVLAFFSWRATLPTSDRSIFRWTRLALLLTLLAASLDEIHQTFVYSRTGSARDVLLDMTGAVFFQLAIYLAFSLRRAKRA
jgi:VanZ family protein